MKKILFTIFILMIVSCNTSKDDIKQPLKTVILDYQKKYPIPTSDKSKGGIYVYPIVFKKEGNDTLITITRSSSGVINNSKGYGVYEDDELFPSFIYDDNNLSLNFILNPKKEIDSKYLLKSKSFRESYPPIYTYVVRKNKINFMKIDTIWSRWN
ncbi:hypothetical protein [Flavobacterium sp.]|jgi:hypothetical protein|uniref:hypothetical protein n=1 Tax=Flavobacterium sp. TaxID=239 RepID=UPI00391A776F